MLQKYKEMVARLSTIIIRENILVILLLATYFYAAYLLNIVNVLNLRPGPEYTVTWGRFTLFTLSFIFLIKLICKFHQGFKGLATICREIRQDYLPIERLAGFFLLTAIIPFFINTFSAFKRAIPRLQPFAWDEAFMKLDFAIHLGHHPWALIQPLFGNPIITRLIDFFYYDVWLIMLSLTLYWMAWHPNRTLRIKFYLSFFLIWILLGTLAATAFSSAGPCYFYQVTGQQGPYTPLLEYLHRVNEGTPLRAVFAQAFLWTAYSKNSSAFGSGISAMPSIHVAGAMLFALLGWDIHRWLGIFLGFYTLLTLIGSVHLGWHYAVDGYFSIILTLLIWHVVDRLLNRRRNFSFSILNKR